eukprot:TRINITY_DN2903_c0_g1_i3.p1 TRINITY_DN2903_c0_g1~~TRINITY_DN2903_c0_g1_i3.p1  ORF type:complete len:666 (+),score=65.93 TRINITY_DN2903_c0_g1_i3:95-2092(+)
MHSILVLACIIFCSEHLGDGHRLTDERVRAVSALYKESLRSSLHERFGNSSGEQAYRSSIEVVGDGVTRVPSAKDREQNITKNIKPAGIADMLQTDETTNAMEFLDLSLDSDGYDCPCCTGWQRHESISCEKENGRYCLTKDGYVCPSGWQRVDTITDCRKSLKSLRVSHYKLRYNDDPSDPRGCWLSNVPGSLERVLYWNPLKGLFNSCDPRSERSIICRKQQGKIPRPSLPNGTYPRGCTCAGGSGSAQGAQAGGGAGANAQGAQAGGGAGANAQGSQAQGAQAGGGAGANAQGAQAGGGAGSNAQGSQAGGGAGANAQGAQAGGGAGANAQGAQAVGGAGANAQGCQRARGTGRWRSRFQRARVAGRWRSRCQRARGTSQAVGGAGGNQADGGFGGFTFNLDFNLNMPNWTTTAEMLKQAIGNTVEVSGSVSDSQNVLTPIDDAELSFFANDTLFGKTVSANGGKFMARLPKDEFVLSVESIDRIGFKRTIDLTKADSINNFGMFPSQKLKEPTYRILLTSNGELRDLHLHAFVGHALKSIDYQNKGPESTGATGVKVHMDRYDENAFGVQTISVENVGKCKDQCEIVFKVNSENAANGVGVALPVLTVQSESQQTVVFEVLKSCEESWATVFVLDAEEGAKVPLRPCKGCGEDLICSPKKE